MKLKRARIWTEEVAFVECPHCDEVEELGSGLVFGDDEPSTCPKCGKDYVQESPLSDEERRRNSMDIGRR